MLLVGGSSTNVQLNISFKKCNKDVALCCIAEQDKNSDFSNIICFFSFSFIIRNVRGVFNKFPDFFVQAFKIVVDSWKFSMLYILWDVYILWDDWPVFMISGSNEQQQQQLEYILLKPDCHSWWISKMQSERYAIKFCLKLGRNATETYGMLQTAFGVSCMNRA